MAIKIGVVGVGVHGMHHVRLLSEMEGVEFAGVCDIDPSVCDRIAAEYDVPASTDLDELLDRADCLSVVVPTTVHFEVVSRCFDAGRHVLVEKPIASSVEEADRLISRADERGLVFGVGHIERFNAAYRAVAGTDIAPAFIESHRLAVFNPRGTDVAVVLDLMIHDIDIVLEMVKSPVVSVHAVGVPVVSDAVDIANARLEFAGGCVANLTASRISQRKLRKIRLFQKNGYISMDFAVGDTEIFTIDPGSRPEASPGALPQLMGGIAYRKSSNDGANALELELRDFIRAVGEGNNPRVSAEAGRNALAVASMVLESMEANARRLT